MKDYTAAKDAFARAEDLIRERQYKEALYLLLQTIQDYPDYGMAYSYLGWLYHQKFSDLKQAEAYYRECLVLSPEYRSNYYNYAMLLSVSRRYDELQELLAKAEEVPGINIGTIYNEYALMYEALGKYGKALDYYKRYLKNCFDNSRIEDILQSIERCEKKQRFFDSH